MANNPEIPSQTADSTGNEPTCYCPVGGVMELLSRRYAMQLICVVGAIGPVRYNEIEDTFGDVSSSTLSSRLKELARRDTFPVNSMQKFPLAWSTN